MPSLEETEAHETADVAEGVEAVGAGAALDRRVEPALAGAEMKMGFIVYLIMCNNCTVELLS
jgi:hypothetical protein